jgi:hypothetical protein
VNIRDAKRREGMIGRNIVVIAIRSDFSRRIFAQAREKVDRPGNY